MTLSESFEKLLTIHKDFLLECADAMEPGVPQAQREALIRKVRSFFKADNAHKESQQKQNTGD